jgi:hypothetical protein
MHAGAGEGRVIFHDVEQNSPEWDELRLGKATASQFACIMANYGKAFGDPAKDYALRLALEIHTGRKAEYSFKNDHMERGHAQEPLARMRYEDDNFVDVTNGGFFCWGRYGDSPDGLVGDDGVVEFKAVIATTHYATIRRGSFDPAYRWQLVGHLDCTARQWVDFGSYCADFPEEKQLIVHRLHRDECAEELAKLRERREQFLSLVDETLIRIRS